MHRLIRKSFETQVSEIILNESWFDNENKDVYKIVT